MSESPSQYVARIEADLRRALAEARDLRVGLSDAEARVLQLEVDLNASDELRAAMVSSAADACRTTVETLRRLEVYQSIVEQAIEWHELEGRAGSSTRLRMLVQLEIDRRGASS